MKRSEKSRAGWYFLLIVGMVYIVLAVLQPETALAAFTFVAGILRQILPIFAVIFILLVLFEYFLTPQTIRDYLGESSGAKRWAIAVGAGIISTGPIYLWYPMLRQLHRSGVGYGFVATFLYNRAVKLPLLPLMILYFGLKYTVVLTAVMVVMSLAQGMLLEKVEGGDRL